jgi:hypothetical protein
LIFYGTKMECKFNDNEFSALDGLPYLQQLVYMKGIRRYMNYRTGITGQPPRGISYKSLSEETYIEPHSGYAGGSPSKPALQRALKGLEKAGLIKPLPAKKQLIFVCLLASQDNFVQNQADTKSIQEGDTRENEKNPRKTGHFRNYSPKADTGKIPEADTHPGTGYNTLSLAKNENQKISNHFQPTVSVIEKAKQLHCPTAGCQDELIKFITHYQASGVTCCDWNAKFLNWLLRAKQYHQEKKNDKQQTTIRSNKKSKRSAVERALSANRDAIGNEGRLIESDSQRHCLALGEYD